MSDFIYCYAECRFAEDVAGPIIRTLGSSILSITVQDATFRIKTLNAGTQHAECCGASVYQAYSFNDFIVAVYVSV